LKAENGGSQNLAIHHRADSDRRNPAPQDTAVTLVPTLLGARIAEPFLVQ